MAIKLIGLGFLVALLLPALIAPVERQRLHDAFYVAIAGSGLIYVWQSKGTASAGGALAQSLLVLLLLGGVIAFTQRRLQARYLTGGEIKLAAGGTTWLPPYGAVLFLLAVAIIILLGILVQRSSFEKRPDIKSISAVTLIIGFGLIGLF